MKVVSHPNVTAFWQAAASVLAADPVRNTLPLTIVGQLRHGLLDGETILLTVHDGPDIVAAALRTHQSSIVLGAVPPDAAVAIAHYLASDGVPLRGATGTEPGVSAFAAAWTERTGDELAAESSECLYRLGNGTTDGAAALIPPRDVPGAPVEATEADIELLTDWQSAAIAEIFGRSPRPDGTSPGRAVARSLAQGNGSILWQVDGHPVALAHVRRPREGMSRIGPVYTPPEQRGHGYGSAVTAAAARWALDRGAEHVVLFTDLANPVSNSIYQRIGFRPVAEGRTVEFRPVRLP